MKIVAIKDLVAYRMENESMVRKEMVVPIRSRYGNVEIHAYRQITTGDIHLAVKMGDWEEDEPVLVRVHSSTETADILGMLFNNYVQQIERSLDRMFKEEKGLLLYMRQGQHRANDIILERLQKINEKGFEMPSDMAQRDFGIGAQILSDMKASKIRLITKNPKRRIALEGYGLEIVEYIEL